MTSTIQNRAAYIDAADQPLRVDDAPTPVPESHEVLIKVHAVAINPADFGRKKMAFFIPKFPYIFGTDAAGVVEAVGSDVTHVKSGDRVLAMSDEFGKDKSSNSAFQAYMKVGLGNVCKIPDSVSFTDAAVVPLGLSTAAGMLFEAETLNLRYPMSSAGLQIFSPTNPEEVVVVWGGSSSLGVNAIQMLRAAGYRAIGIARAHNFELLKQCGADACFDYSDGDMVVKLAAFVKEKGWVSAGIAAVAGFLPPGPEAEKTAQRCGEIALKLGGKKFVSTCLARGIMPVPTMPEGVEASNCFALSDEKAAEHIWLKWMPGALESGILKCMPPADIVGEGLESIGPACDAMGNGVSGKKLVVKIC